MSNSSYDDDDEQDYCDNDNDGDRAVCWPGTFPTFQDDKIIELIPESPHFLKLVS